MVEFNHLDVLVSPDATVHDVLARIDAASSQMALVADADGRLLGTATDGDIRRGLLAGVGLTSPIRDCMHTDPFVFPVDATNSEVVSGLRARGLRHAPVVDADRRVVGLKILDDLIAARRRDNPVVLMVGGLGARLGELTRETPKPMLSIGGRPILEHIMLRLLDQGFHEFHLAVNYKAEVIEAHFGDGSRFGCRIAYLREKRRMGTAGALSLLPELGPAPVLVANGDLVTNVDFGALIDHHVRSGAEATIAVRPHEVSVPFGVIDADGDRFVGVREKPVFQHIIAAGIYALSPSALDVVPADAFFDMPEVFRELAHAGRHAGVYRMADYWIDIGRPLDLERAAREFDLEGSRERTP